MIFLILIGISFADTLTIQLTADEMETLGLTPTVDDYEECNPSNTCEDTVNDKCNCFGKLADEGWYCNKDTLTKAFKPDEKEKCKEESERVGKCKEKPGQKECKAGDICNGIKCKNCGTETVEEDGKQVERKIENCVCNDKECVPADEVRLWGECGNDDDGICPQGCYIWWDEDCGGEDNIFTVAFDMIWRYTGWGERIGEWWRESVLGDLVQDPWDYLEESWCNPRKNTPLHPEHAAQSAVYCGQGTVCGWVGGERVLYNDTHFLYTIQWMVGNLERDAFETSYLNSLEEDKEPVAHYKIKLKYDGGEYTAIPADPSKEWISIGLGEVNDGYDTVRSFFSQRNYTTICLTFKEKIYGYNDYCRDLATDTWNRRGEAVTSQPTGPSGDTNDDGEHNLNEDTGGVRPE